MLAKIIFSFRNAVHETSQLQWVERDIYCTSCFHTTCPLISKKMKGIFRNYIERPIIPLTNQWNKSITAPIHHHIKTSKLSIWKITLKAFALIAPLHPFFSVAQTHPRWRQSTAVNTFCLLSVTEQQEITPEKQFYSQKSTEAEEKILVKRAPILR